uniref:histidinol-phosphate transaminase n=1 Tax=Fagus sylvatica TaxID=28930 RepID=A0A2N9FE72_FAGSY
MKMNSNHHGSGPWWLLPLVCIEPNLILFFEEIKNMFRFLFPCVCCVEGVATTSVQVAFRLPFYLGLRPFLIGESAVDYFLSAVWEEWQLPLFMLPSGLAGLRVGYGAFPLSIIEYLWRAKQPYNVSAAAEISACAALQNPTYLEVATKFRMKCSTQNYELTSYEPARKMG